MFGHIRTISDHIRECSDIFGHIRTYSNNIRTYSDIFGHIRTIFGHIRTYSDIFEPYSAHGPGPWAAWAGPWAGPGPGWARAQAKHVFVGLMTSTKKTRSACTIRLPAVSRRDLCYASENEGFRSRFTNWRYDGLIPNLHTSSGGMTVFAGMINTTRHWLLPFATIR